VLKLGIVDLRRNLRGAFFVCLPHAEAIGRVREVFEDIDAAGAGRIEETGESLVQSPCAVAVFKEHPRDAGESLFVPEACRQTFFRPFPFGDIDADRLELNGRTVFVAENPVCPSLAA